ncbi:MAG: CAP domain-containing protein [Lachnospiraceae bacterium]|nr:CAP domain-containing protein [Lachnospiraceae bacterium]
MITIINKITRQSMRTFACLVVVFLLFNFIPVYPQTDICASVYAAKTSTVPVRISMYKNYKKAYKVLALINEERTKAGLNPVTMSKSLMKSAMTRAAESALYWDHTRPDGTDCFTVSDIVDGENIGVGASSPEYIMKSFMESHGHKSNILDPDWVSVGIGCVVVDDTYYWSQLFSSLNCKPAKKSSYKNGHVVKTIKVKNTKKFFRPVHKIASKKLKVGKKTSITSVWNNTYTLVNLDSKSLRYKSSNTKVCSISKNGIIKAKKKGTAKVKVWFRGYKDTARTFTVKVR